MQQQFLVYNGKIVHSTELNLGLNRAFRYGDGLFETVRIRDGEPHLLDLHFDRLFKGLETLKIELTPLQKKQLKDRIPKLIDKNKIDKGGILRIFIYRSGGGRYMPTANAADYLLEAEPIAQNHFQLNERGLHLGFSENSLVQSTDFATLKSLNALAYVMAAVEAKEGGFDDLLLFNNDKHAVEATASNLFLLFKNEIHTPMLSDGCLPGVMRKNIIDLANKNGYKVVERSIGTEDLFSADECFLSNSVSGIRWVVALKSKRYFNRSIKEIFKLL